MKKSHFFFLALFLLLNLSLNHLTFGQSSSYTVFDTTLCQGSHPFAWNNLIILTDYESVYIDTLVNSVGYDSIVSLYVSIIPSTISIMDTTIYEGMPEFVWNDQTIKTNRDSIYISTFVNSVGCDSIVTLNVIIIKGSLIQMDTAVCESFTWAEGDGHTYTTSGIYDYIVGNGASGDTLRLDLVVSPPMIIEATPTNVLCYGDSTGSINVSVSGGLAPYNYMWNTGDITQDLINLPAGLYEVKVIDSLGCTNSITVEITHPSILTVSVDQITNVTVPDELIGSIDVTVAGGTPPYTYEWVDQLGNMVGNSEDLLNQHSGIYRLLVTDANGCIVFKTVEITEPTLNNFSCPSDIYLECFEELANYPFATTLTEFIALDTYINIFSECGIDTVSFTYMDSIVGASNWCYEVIRKYSVVDSCGEKLSCNQAIIVNDIEVPELICKDITVSNGIIPAPYTDTAEFRLDGGYYSENCGIVSFRQIGGDISDGGTNPEIITRIYEVEDYCGNTARCAQNIEVFTIVDFALDCGDLPDVYYECRDNIPDYSNIDDFVAAGGKYFSSLDIEAFYYVDEVLGSFCPTINRSYTIVNVAGDTITCTQSIEIIDIIAPTLILPDKFLNSGETWPVYSSIDDLIQYTEYGNMVYDNCGNEALSTLSLLSQAVVRTSPTVIERVYRLYDRCGNFSETIEIIYVGSENSPYIKCLPNTTIQLGNDLYYSLNWEMVVDSVSYMGIDTILLDNYHLDCDNIGLTTITATAYDTIGNFSSCTSEFLVYGNTPPIAQNDTVYTGMGTSINIMVATNDYDLNSNLNLSSLAIVRGASHGTVSMDNRSGVFKYTPDPGYMGTDSFRYSICDDGIPCIPMCDGAEVYLNIGNSTNVLEDFNVISDFNIFPNPTNGIFSINVSGLKSQSINLYVLDINGRQIFETKLAVNSGSITKEINLADEPKGIYAVKIADGSVVTTMTVIIK